MQKMGLWTILEGFLLLAMAMAILNEDRFLAPRGWSFSEFSTGQTKSFKGQLIGLIYATQYMRLPLILLNAICIVVQTPPRASHSSCLLVGDCMPTYSRSAPSSVNQVLRAAPHGTLALDRAQETKSSLRTVPSVVGGLATLFCGCYFAVSALYTWSIKQGRY
ncbi:hypothetical protein Goklo_000257 [Gossypium klotzschianum]|uniref:Yos1-like protein n=1 Tax=Gossypium klotzschianum TaxID=34286 RepID=A0A7J8VWZ9_9ROSI|nr:hypothetical protein [Gossypium klotzschianum]